MKVQLENLKETLKERAEIEAQITDLTAEKNVSKDLVLWKRKLDEMKSKTLKKRQQLQALQDKQNEISAL